MPADQSPEAADPCRLEGLIWRRLTEAGGEKRMSQQHCLRKGPPEACARVSRFVKVVLWPVPVGTLARAACRPSPAAAHRARTLEQQAAQRHRELCASCGPHAASLSTQQAVMDDDAWPPDCSRRSDLLRLDEQAACAICYGPYNTPLTVPCGHSCALPPFSGQQGSKAAAAGTDPRWPALQSALPAYAAIWSSRSAAPRPGAPSAGSAATAGTCAPTWPCRGWPAPMRPLAPC